MKSYIMYGPSHCGEIIFVNDEILAKMPQKPNFESRKIRSLGENGINSKLKQRKAYNSILSGRFGDPYGRPGGLACMLTFAFR